MTHLYSMPLEAVSHSLNPSHSKAPFLYSQVPVSRPMLSSSTPNSIQRCEDDRPGDTAETLENHTSTLLCSSASPQVKKQRLEMSPKGAIVNPQVQEKPNSTPVTPINKSAIQHQEAEMEGARSLDSGSIEPTQDILPERRESWTRRLHPAVRGSQLCTTAPIHYTQLRQSHWPPVATPMPWWDRPMPHLRPYPHPQPIWGAIAYTSDVSSTRKRDHETAFSDVAHSEFRPSLPLQTSQPPFTTWGMNMSYVEMLQDPSFPQSPDAWLNPENKTTSAPLYKFVAPKLMAQPAQSIPLPGPKQGIAMPAGGSMPGSNFDSRVISCEPSPTRSRPTVLQLYEKGSDMPTPSNDVLSGQTPAISNTDFGPIEQSQQTQKSISPQISEGAPSSSDSIRQLPNVEAKTAGIAPLHVNQQSSPDLNARADLSIAVDVTSPAIQPLGQTCSPTTATDSSAIPVGTINKASDTNNQSLMHSHAILVEDSDRVQQPANQISDLQRKPSLYSIPHWRPNISPLPPSEVPIIPASRNIPSFSAAPSALNSATHAHGGRFHVPQMSCAPHHTMNPATSTSRRYPPNIVIDIAQTCQEIFPFAQVAQRHGKSTHQVVELFSAIIQLPLLRQAGHGSPYGSLATERLNEYCEARRAMDSRRMDG